MATNLIYPSTTWIETYTIDDASITSEVLAAATIEFVAGTVTTSEASEVITLNSDDHPDQFAIDAEALTVRVELTPDDTELFVAATHRTQLRILTESGQILLVISRDVRMGVTVPSGGIPPTPGTAGLYRRVKVICHVAISDSVVDDVPSGELWEYFSVEQGGWVTKDDTQTLTPVGGGGALTGTPTSTQSGKTGASIARSKHSRRRIPTGPASFTRTVPGLALGR